MKEWRIIQIAFEDKLTYKVQKRLFGFGPWFNPLNFDAETTGYYGSIADAKQAISRFRTSPRERIIWED